MFVKVECKLATNVYHKNVKLHEKNLGWNIEVNMNFTFNVKTFQNDTFDR
jgi:hypothetical protein